MINQLLEKNDIMVRIGSTWYRLDEITFDEGLMPIYVSDDDGETFEFDMADVDDQRAHHFNDYSNIAAG